MASAKLPSLQFYPGDWMKDPDLRRCSHAAKGIWIDMLCLMFECGERGVLATAGQPWTREEIAQAVGGDCNQTLSGIDELSVKGVVKVRSDGAYYSCRMVRDEQRRKTNVANGKKGGNPHLTSSVNRFSNRDTNREANRDSTPSSSSSSSLNNRPEGPVGRGNGKWRRPGIVTIENTKRLMEWADSELPKAGILEITDCARTWIIAIALRAIDRGDKPPLLFAELFHRYLSGDKSLLEEYLKRAEVKFREWKPRE